MRFSKDDPMYYKMKIQELIKQAREEGLDVALDTQFGIIFTDNQTGEVMIAIV